MSQQVFKFISLPSEILVGEGLGNHHVHLLRQNLGINYFPPETVAIGTGLIEESGYIDGISFDFGDKGGKMHAMDQLQGWALERGYQLGASIHDIYKHGADTDSWTAQRVEHNFGFAIAFAWIDGQLHLGSSHPAILANLYSDWNKFGDEIPGAFSGIFGYIFPPHKVEIYSDFFDQNYDEVNLENLLKQIRQRWDITEVSYGPDKQTLDEMKQYFDDPRQARLAFIDKHTNV